MEIFIMCQVNTLKEKDTNLCGLLLQQGGLKKYDEEKNQKMC